MAVFGLKMLVFEDFWPGAPMGNNPMVGATVALAVAVSTAK